MKIACSLKKNKCRATTVSGDSPPKAEATGETLNGEARENGAKGDTGGGQDDADPALTCFAATGSLRTITQASCLDIHSHIHPFSLHCHFSFERISIENSCTTGFASIFAFHFPCNFIAALF